MRISDWSSDVCSSDLSNVVPSAFRRLADLARAGKEADAQALDARLRALYDFLGIESNPIPVKALLARRGAGRGLRLPLTELSAAHPGLAARRGGGVDGVEIGRAASRERERPMV